MGEKINWKQSKRDLLRVMDIVCIMILMTVVQFVNTHTTVHLQRGNFILYKLYLNKSDLKYKNGHGVRWGFFSDCHLDMIQRSFSYKDDDNTQASAP